MLISWPKYSDSKNNKSLVNNVKKTQTILIVIELFVGFVHEI